MITKTKTALIAAFVLGSASAALAQSGEEFQNSAYQLNPAAPVPVYQQQQQSALQPSFEGRNVLIEGRNVAVAGQTQIYAPQPVADPLESFGGY